MAVEFPVAKDQPPVPVAYHKVEVTQDGINLSFDTHDTSVVCWFPRLNKGQVLVLSIATTS